MKKISYLDSEERELMQSFATVDKSKLVKPSKNEQKIFIDAAKEYLKNETKMNIRIDPGELKIIKEYAANEGLKYQTFVKSILHKYVTGQLIEKKKM